MDHINWLRVRRISLVLLANAGLSGGSLAIAGAFSGGGYVCWLFLVVQALILFRMLRRYAVEKGTAVFLSILLTVTGWVVCFLLIAGIGRIVC